MSHTPGPARTVRRLRRRIIRGQQPDETALKLLECQRCHREDCLVDGRASAVTCGRCIAESAREAPKEAA